MNKKQLIERKEGQISTTKYICPYCGRKLMIFVDKIENGSEVVICKSCEHLWTIDYLRRKVIRNETKKNI